MPNQVLPTLVALHDFREGRPTIYYVDKHRNIKWFRGIDDSIPENQSENPLYEGPKGPLTLFKSDSEDPVNVKVNEQTRTIAVVDWVFNGVPQVRIYYVNEEGNLQEAVWTKGQNNDRFRPGTLNNADGDGFSVEPKSVLTAAVFEHYLKVYFQEKDREGLLVAFVGKDQEIWASRRVVRSFDG